MNDAHRPPFECANVKVNGEVIITVRGEIDACTGPQLWTCLEEATAVSDRVVLDLGAVPFMDSTGINLIVRVHERLGRNPASIVLRKPQRPVMRVLEITGFDQCMTIQH